MNNFADMYFVETRNPHVIYVLPRPSQTLLETLLGNEKVLELLRQLLVDIKMNGRTQHAAKRDEHPRVTEPSGPAHGLERETAATD